MRNLKVVRDRIFTGTVVQQFLSMALLVSFLVAICVGIGVFFNVATWDNIVESFLNPSHSWQNWSGSEKKEGLHGVLPVVGFLGTIFFSGALVAILTNAIKDYREKIVVGAVEYKLKDHVVVIGFDEVVPSLIRQLVRSDKYKGAYILLQSSTNLDVVKDKIHSKLTEAEEKRVVYMHFLRPSKEELRKLHTESAKEIFVVGERTADDHDSENMHIMRMLHDIHNKLNAKQKPVTVWFEQETSFAALQLNDVKKAWNNRFDFTPFNFYKDWADRLLLSSHYHRGEDIIIYPEMDHKGIPATSNKHVHVVIIGMNRMGIAVAKEAAHMLHFPNFNEESLENQTVITFVDDHADKELRFLQGRHPGYFEIAPTYFCDASNVEDIIFEQDNSLLQADKNFLDVRFQFIKGRVESSSIRKWLVEQAKDKTQYLSLVVCLHNPSKSLGSGLYLPEELYKADDDHYTNIFIRQETSSSMVESLRKAAEEGKNKRYAHIYPFGMLNNSFDLDCMDTTMAQAFNYIYNYYFAHSKLIPLSLPKRDELFRDWQDLTIANQWSNIYLADSFEFKLRSIGYDINSGKPLAISDKDNDNLARVEHNRWNMEKLLIGYRALHEDEWKDLENGKVTKNQLKNEQFVHNCLVPYDKLSKDDKVLDKNIIETLPMVVRYGL